MPLIIEKGFPPPEESPEEKKNKVEKFLEEKSIPIGAILLALIIQMFTTATSEQTRQ